MIEIGQFLYMKKLENKKIIHEIIRKLSIACIPNVSDAFRKEPTSSTKPIERKQANLNSGASLVECIFLLSDVMKVLPLRYFTSSNIFSSIGPRNRVIQNKREEISPYGWSSFRVSKAKEDPMPNDITDANTRFHLRVWVNQLLLFVFAASSKAFALIVSKLVFCINFVCNYGLKTHYLIISKIKLNAKQIMLITTIILGNLIPLQARANIHVVKDVNQEKVIASLIEKEERRYGIPRGLLRSIAKTESNMNPYVLGERGQAIKFTNSVSALDVLEAKVRSGISNIDIGIMQINYKWHKCAFGSLKEMLDPARNIAYAAKMLKSLKDKFGDWQKAIRHYHSSNLSYSRSYSRKVTLAWLEI